MSAWIQLDAGLFEHWRLRKMAQELGRPDYACVGHLASLWTFTLRNAWRDGNLEPWGDAGIEQAARWDGEPGAFVRAAREAGFLDGSRIHDWLDRAGKLVLDRLQKQKQRRERISALAQTQVSQKVGDKSQTFDARGRGRETGTETERGTGSASALRAFLQSYPQHRLGQQMTVENAWTGLGLSDEAAKAVLAGLDAWKRSDDWTKDGGKFVPNAEKFMLERRWERAPAPKPDVNAEIVARLAATQEYLSRTGRAAA